MLVAPNERKQATTEGAMKLREMEIFRAIMLGGSISEAARILNVSQPAVSTALRYMEDRLGMNLFRRGEGARLFDAGSRRPLRGNRGRIRKAGRGFNGSPKTFAIRGRGFSPWPARRP